MEKQALTIKEIVSGEYDKYIVRIGNNKYYTEFTAFDFKNALHAVKSFVNSYGEPEFARIGKNPKYKGDTETITIP